jgi:hypothetical protein
VENICKQFAESLNKSLDDLEVPIQIRERAVILSKILDIPKQLAYNLLEGTQMPDADLLARITSELDIETLETSKK